MNICCSCGQPVPIVTTFGAAAAAPAAIPTLAWIDTNGTVTVNIPTVLPNATAAAPRP